MPITMACVNCGKIIVVKPYKIRTQKAVSCSYECAYAIRRGRPIPARRRRVELTCEVCGKHFIETEAHSNQRRFCSIACKAEYQKTALQGENNPYYGRTHSDEARALISQNHFRAYGEDNPNWRGGVTDLRLLIRKSKKYKEWREAVYKRDGYRSRISGCTGRLTVHHVRPFSDILDEFLGLHIELDPDGDDKVDLLKLALAYDLFWDLDNGITMLRDEHIALHQNEEDGEDEDD